MPKKFHLTWVYEPLVELDGFATKRMFGGMSVSVFGRMVLMLAEDPGNKEWRGESYSFDIWNGVLFPTDREHHASLQEEFPDLVSHPVLGKWLYLPMNCEDFESVVESLVGAISANDERFGIYPKVKKSKKKKKKKTLKKREKKSD